MARVAAAEFGDKEVVRVYLAGRLAEAQSVEAELDRRGIDYAIAVEPYLTGTLLGVREYRGAAFYILAEQA